MTSGLALADVEDDLVWGIETVTGLRSDYIFRGFELADATLEAQIETEISLGDDLFLGLAAWHIAESGDDFSETSFGLNLRRDWKDFSLTGSLDYRFYNSESLFDDGADLGVKAQWFFGQDWEIAAKANYDFGAEGAYFAVEGSWSQPLNEKTFIEIETGLSAVTSYYERSGINDFYGKVSLTYNLNSFLSVTPFVGFSLGLADEASEHVYLGIWSAVSF